jgi:hypothetical protein
MIIKLTSLYIYTYLFMNVYKCFEKSVNILKVKFSSAI